MSKLKLLSVFLLLFVSIVLLAPGSVGAQDVPVPDWPELYDPFTLLDYHIEMAPGDWTTIVGDTTFDIEVPAKFWAEGEDPILVSVRRKSADLLGSDKISLKVDINEYEDGGVCDGDYGYPGVPCVSKWHGVKKLSLENGDDNNVVTEGLAWYLHSEAAKTMNYHSGMASWVTVTVNGDLKGVYVNVEQPDKQYLKNRGLWDGDDTWLIKYSDIDDPVIKEYPFDDVVPEYFSPLYDDFCWLPFQTSSPCDTPDDFKEQLNANTNMEGLLTFGAVTAFQGSPDDLYAKDKNFYFVDYTTAGTGLREYLEWDLDSAFVGNKPTASIYDQGKPRADFYEEALIESSNAPFRNEYNGIMWRLLDGPFNEADLHTAFDDIEAAIGTAVDNDPLHQMGQNSATTFANLKEFITERRNYIEGVLPPRPAVPTVSITNLSEGATVSDTVIVMADATDPGGAGIMQVEFFVDGGSIGVDLDGDDGWSVPWDTTASSDAAHTVSATATTALSTATDSVNVIVSNLATPEVTITYPTDGLTVSGVVVVTADASDLAGDGVTQVAFFVNGEPIGIDSNGLDGWSASWDTTLDLDGLYTVTSEATNTVGQSATDSVDVTVDNVDDPPAVTIVSPATDSTVSGSVLVEATASDDNGVTQVVFYVDGNPIGVDDNGDDGWSAYWDTTVEYPDGSYTVSAMATDTALQTSSDHVSVMVNNALPATMHLGNLNGVANPGSRGKWTATATITVHDSLHDPVAGVVVSGAWSGDYVAAGSCTTNSSGQCSITTGTLNKNKSSVTFAVTNLSGSLVYVPAGNDVSESIAINK